jgi:hypothetical protein
LNRIRHLENVVLSLSNQNAESQKQITELSESLPATSSADGGQAPSAVAQNFTTGKGNIIDSPGMMRSGQMGTRWVDATHWEAILDDVGAQNVENLRSQHGPEANKTKRYKSLKIAQTHLNKQMTSFF